MQRQITVDDIAELLEEMIPTQLAEDWDNVGLLLGRRSRPVSRIMLALDLTAATAAQALAFRADMLLTHHPVIFKSLASITGDAWQQELLLQLAEQGIAVYSAHTNLDCVPEGVNDSLARRLQLTDDDVLDSSSGLGRIGSTEPCSLADYAAFVKKALHADYVAVGDAGRQVRRVAVCGGAGSDLLQLALERGADTLVTGDVKYHSAQDAVFSGLNIIDAGHQATELPVLEDLADRLSLRFAEKNWDIIVRVAAEELLLQHI